MTVLVIFGSKSDEDTYKRICGMLGKEKIRYELRIASAHKTPELVDRIISGKYELVIAGAGLAAHLPGVVASKKTVPVLGVPCKGAYGGLDAFLSIAQMPPGVPVLCVEAENAAKEAKKILAKKDKVAVVGEGKAAENAMKTLEELGIAFEMSETATRSAQSKKAVSEHAQKRRSVSDMGDVAEDAVNIVFVELGKAVDERKELIIYCPVGKAEAEEAVDAMNAARHGLWVGANNGENAAVAAAEILGKDLSEYRKRIAAKVISADEEARR